MLDLHDPVVLRRCGEKLVASGQLVVGDAHVEVVFGVVVRAGFSRSSIEKAPLGNQRSG